MIDDIDTAVVADAPLLAAVHSASAALAYADIFPGSADPPTPADLTPAWLAMIEDPDSWVFVLRRSGPVVGGVALRPDGDVPTGQLLAKLYVHPEHWGAGYGSALLEHAVLAAWEVSDGLNLWVLEHNTGARKLYERRGWQLVPDRYLANDPPEVRDVLYQLDRPADDRPSDK